MNEKEVPRLNDIQANLILDFFLEESVDTPYTDSLDSSLKVINQMGYVGLTIHNCYLPKKLGKGEGLTYASADTTLALSALSVGSHPVGTVMSTIVEDMFTAPQAVAHSLARLLLTLEWVSIDILLEKQ